MSLTPDLRFSPAHPCPICGGHDGAPRGRGERCYGFLSSDRQYARCTREEYGDGLERQPSSGTYPHRLTGECPCGVRHDGRAAPPTDGHRSKGTIVATYDYRDEDGRVLFQVVRKEPKGFYQQRPDGEGRVTYTLDGVRRAPYRLPELLAADPERTVFDVEGEKDADRLWSEGLVPRQTLGAPRGRSTGMPRRFEAAAW